MAAQNRPRPFGLVLVCLVGVGAVLSYLISQAPTEIAPAAAAGVTLHAAAEQGDLAAINAQLKQHVPVDQARDATGDRKGETPLMAAAYSGHVEAVRALLKAGAQMNARSGDGNTALILAAGWGDIDSVRALLESAAEVNAKNKWGQTALILAAKAGDAVKVRALLAAGATVNDADLDSMTAITFAAATDGPTTMLDALIAAKADVNVCDSEGVTPLMRAAGLGDGDKVMALLNAGARATATDKQGRTAADWAKARSGTASANLTQLLDEAAH
jgi:ankyrin repeat protein